MAVCKNCDHECHHGNGGKCHCGCLNCEHDIKDALDKLEEIENLFYETKVEFEADFDLDSKTH
jgi:hypothetical protein|tara:strand:+ start:245 stop:433 length:189 start_codon:yes stop_codon:yes gene_type:complete